MGNRVFRLSRDVMIFYIFMQTAFTAFALLIVVPILIHPPQDGPPTWFTAPWLFLGIPWIWYWFLTTPFEIHVHNGSIMFRALMRRRVVQVKEITRVTRGFLSWQHAVVRYSRGRVLLPLQFEGFYDFLSFLRQTNPQIEIKGL